MFNNPENSKENSTTNNITNSVNAKFVCIKAHENGVSIIGMTRGKDTKLSHTEKLDKGEVCLMQFTENVSAIKIRGHAEIITEFCSLESK